MPNGQWVTNEEVEGCLRGLGLPFLMGPQSGLWVLPWRDPEKGESYMLIVDNGRAAEGYIVIHNIMMRVSRNHDCVHKALNLVNGCIALATVVMDRDNDVIIRSVMPRLRPLFNCEMLRHALGAVLAARNLARPVVDCCMNNENCDPEAALRQRLRELGVEAPGIAPPRPLG